VALRFTDLPLFASEKELATALLGQERASEWRALVPLYEKRGFPKIDPLMGGRYTPAVKAFFDHDYRLTPDAPAAPPGAEKVITWNDRKRRA
jgi:hypothetical protein